MSTIKYPTAISPVNVAQSNTSYSQRGMSLESDINDSNKYYRACDIALIYKKPTPIQVVRVDYPARNKAKIVEAYYKTPSTTDYNGIYKGRYIDFEAKETKNKTGFPKMMIHQHQIDHLEKVKLHKGIGFFIIRFTHYQQTFLVDAISLIEEYRHTTKSYISYKWFLENGQLIKEGLHPRLSYLQVVDAKYFKED